MELGTAQTKQYKEVVRKYYYSYYTYICNFIHMETLKKLGGGGGGGGIMLATSAVINPILGLKIHGTCTFLNWNRSQEIE